MIEFTKRCNAELEAIRPTIDRFPWEDRQAYAMWLSQTHYFVNHSTRLAALAAARMPLDREPLHERFVNHALEERGHAQWCAEDLAGLGTSLDAYPCLYQTAALYQTQYYWIEHRSPISLLGYIYWLESLAAKFGREVFAKMKDDKTRPTKFLKGHAEDDPQHVEQATKQISALSDEERELVWENFELSARLYRAMLDEIMKQLQR